MSATALYRHYDASGALLYVGIAANPLSRTKAHQADSPWFRDVARIEVEWLPDRAAAKDAEAAAITNERPLHNRRHAVIEGGVAGTLSQWPTRASLLEDARVFDSGLDLVAVHRWFKRGRVPSRHWLALAEGARRRGIPFDLESFAFAHTEAAE